MFYICGSATVVAYFFLCIQSLYIVIYDTKTTYCINTAEIDSTHSVFSSRSQPV